MPYIKQEDRDRLLTTQDAFPETAGELNFVISTIIHGYTHDKMQYNLNGDSTLSYALLNEVMGVLACVQAEFYRRVVAPYENKKQEENGDVFYPL